MASIWNDCDRTAHLVAPGCARGESLVPDGWRRCMRCRQPRPPFHFGWHKTGRLMKWCMQCRGLCLHEKNRKNRCEECRVLLVERTAQKEHERDVECTHPASWSTRPEVLSNVSVCHPAAIGEFYDKMLAYMPIPDLLPLPRNCAV